MNVYCEVCDKDISDGGVFEPWATYMCIECYKKYFRRRENETKRLNPKHTATKPTTSI